MAELSELMQHASYVLSHIEPGDSLHCTQELVVSGLADLEARLEKAELATQSSEAVIAMAIARLAGKVEGFPTQRINFLQRIDELCEKETRLESATEELAELKRHMDRCDLADFHHVQQLKSRNKKLSKKLEAAERDLATTRETLRLMCEKCDELERLLRFAGQRACGYDVGDQSLSFLRSQQSPEPADIAIAIDLALDRLAAAEGEKDG